MRNPSVKTLTTYLGITEEKAKKIRSILTGPPLPTTRLEAIDEVLGTFGVEYIQRGRNQKSPAIDYCNTGDPYKPTVMKVYGLNGAYFTVGCWGDIVERGNYD